MAKYRGRFVFGGVDSGKVMDNLRVGDELSLIGAFGKINDVKIKETYRYQNKRVYITDQLGLIYADEVVAVNMPTWKNGIFTRKAKVV